MYLHYFQNRGKMEQLFKKQLFYPIFLQQYVCSGNLITESASYGHSTYKESAIQIQASNLYG